MRRFLSALFFAAAVLTGAHAIHAADTSGEDPKKLVDQAKPVPLPDGIVWETDNDEPLIGSDKAIRGGTLNAAIYSYPLTFRLMGPNSNDYFSGWNRLSTFNFTLVAMHPETDKFIPMLATHWSVQKDQKTIYFKLDKDAKWSDGHAITADDYVFTWRMMQSKFLLDPFYNTFAEQYIESVDKVDDYTLRVIGKIPSWRPLYDYGIFWPTPAHATVLDKDWVTRTTNEFQIVAGPYVVSDVVRGKSVTLKHVPNWWGDKKRYFVGQYNFDQIHLRVIAPERELDYVRQGELDMMIEASAKTWNEGYDFPAVQNGWLRRARIFVDFPRGLRGLQLNMTAPIFANRDFRLAVQHLIDFERINHNLQYDEYFRKQSFFDGSEYANPDVHAYPFDPAKAREYLNRAGYHLPHSTSNQGFWAKLRDGVTGIIFTRSDADDILVNDKGEPARFTLIYGSKTSEGVLTVIQQDFRRAGIDVRLQLLENGTLFERALTRKYEAVLLRMETSIYPDPRGYLGSEFKDAKESNDFWGFGTEEVDKLLDIFDKDLEFDRRRDAMWRIDQIVHDEAFYLPFWDSPFVRLVYWDYIQMPDTYLPRQFKAATDVYTDWVLTYWIDPAKKKALEEAMRDNKPYPVDKDLDKDFYNVRQKFQ